MKVSIKVFDISGRKVATLINEEIQPGTYEVRFDVSSVMEFPSGIYYYRMETEKFSETKKMIYLK